MENYSILLLGTPQIKLVQQTLTLARQRSIALLAYLVVRDAPVSRAAISVTLWPDAPASLALTSLRAVLVDLRKTLGKPLIQTTHQTISPAKEGYWCDVTHFRRLLAGCLSHRPRTNICPSCLEKLVEAIHLVRGEFLAGFCLRRSNLFEDWQTQQTIQLRQEVHTVLEMLIHGYAQRGEYTTAIQYLQRWLASDPHQERAHRKLMELYALNGEPETALRHYQAYQKMLVRKWNAQPQVETADLFNTILNRGPLPPLPARGI